MGRGGAAAQRLRQRLWQAAAAAQQQGHRARPAQWSQNAWRQLRGLRRPRNSWSHRRGWKHRWPLLLAHLASGTRGNGGCRGNSGGGGSLMAQPSHRRKRGRMATGMTTCSQGATSQSRSTGCTTCPSSARRRTTGNLRTPSGTWRRAWRKRRWPWRLRAKEGDSVDKEEAPDRRRRMSGQPNGLAEKRGRGLWTRRTREEERMKGLGQAVSDGDSWTEGLRKKGDRALRRPRPWSEAAGLVKKPTTSSPSSPLRRRGG